MDISKTSAILTVSMANEFDKIKDRFHLTYEKDFEAFCLGYTMSVFGTIKTIKNTAFEEINAK